MEPALAGVSVQDFNSMHGACERKKKGGGREFHKTFIPPVSRIYIHEVEEFCLSDA